MKNSLDINNTVKKYYHSAIACDNEHHLLALIKNSGICADVISREGNCIETAVIKGPTLAQMVDNCTITPEITQLFADFISAFNRITQNIVLDDINLKNFIYSDNKVWGIDFENWHHGDNTLNFAAAIAALNTAYFPDEQKKTRLCNYMEKYIAHTAAISADTLRKMVNIHTEKILLRRRAIKKIRQSDCVILSGGKSSRMGRPKGLLCYNGYTFMDHIIYNTSAFDRQYISANDGLYSDFGCEVIPDIYKEKGPMGAIHAALETCESESVFFIPCDMPFITEQTVFTLFDHAHSGADAVVFTTGGRVFPTVAIYRKTSLPQLIKQLESGNYKMMELLENINTQFVEAPSPRQFLNINTPDDYKNIKEKTR